MHLGGRSDDLPLVRDPDVAGAGGGVLERDQRRTTAEAALLDQEPARRSGTGIDPDILEPPDARAIDVIDT
jgi:hypothetical protein